MRRRQLSILLLIPLIVLGCSSPSAQGGSVVSLEATTTPSPAASTGESGILACYYVWSTQELPALSETLDTALKSAVAGATGSAYAYGEDCVSANGSRQFTAMETDFRVRVQAGSLSDETQLGDSIAAVMQVIERIPKDQLVGPQAGRVDFEFYDANAESLRLSVEIARFDHEATGLHGADLFKLFHTGP